MSIRRVLCLAVALGLLASSCSKPAGVTPFKVGLATYPGFGPGFVALEDKLFGSLPVEFTILDDFNARHSAFVAGSTQATIATLDSYAFESKGVDSKIVLVLDESAGADALVAKGPITGVAGLRGKKVAYTRGSPSHFLLLTLLERHGLTHRDISSVEVDDPGRAGEAFVSGTVDAAVTWEPNVSQIVKSGAGHVLATSKELPGLIVDVLLVNRNVYDTRKADVQQLVDGWLNAVDKIRSGPARTYPIMARAFKIPEQQFPEMVAGLKYADRNRNKELLVPAETGPASNIYAKALAFWRDLGLTSTTAAPQAVITSEFVAGRQ